MFYKKNTAKRKLTMRFCNFEREGGYKTQKAVPESFTTQIRLTTIFFSKQRQHCSESQFPQCVISSNSHILSHSSDLESSFYDIYLSTSTNFIVSWSSLIGTLSTIYSNIPSTFSAPIAGLRLILILSKRRSVDETASHFVVSNIVRLKPP